MQNKPSQVNNLHNGELFHDRGHLAQGGQDFAQADPGLVRPGAPEGFHIGGRGFARGGDCPQDREQEDGRADLVRIQTARGMPLANCPVTPIWWNAYGRRLAKVAPMPIKNDCMTKPAVRCSMRKLVGDKGAERLHADIDGTI